MQSSRSGKNMTAPRKDTDSSGTISREEFPEVVKEAKPMAWELVV